MRIAGSRLLQFGQLSGYWFRAVQLRHYQSLLAYAHTANIPSRFNAADRRNPFPILYFTENQHVALWETRALIGSPFPGGIMSPNPSASWVIISVRVKLQSVVDLTRRLQRRNIGTTVQELTGDWQGYRLRRPTPPAKHPFTDVPTQQLGAELARQSGVEGLISYSAVDSRYKNLVVFPDKLQPGSWIKFLNPITGRTDRIGP